MYFPFVVYIIYYNIMYTCISYNFISNIIFVCKYTYMHTAGENEKINKPTSFLFPTSRHKIYIINNVIVIIYRLMDYYHCNNYYTRIIHVLLRRIYRVLVFFFIYICIILCDQREIFVYIFTITTKRVCV